MPQDVKNMRSFLSLINYLNRFSPHLAELSDLLREICRQKMEFKLNRACEIAFECCKEEISKNITLLYYNPKDSTIVQRDASKKGLRAVLTQNSSPVMFASRALTGSERNYQNLEHECLATIWGMEKFHYFLYGKEFNFDRPKATSINLQETYGGNLYKNPEVSSKKLPTSTFQCAVQERSRNSTSRCSQ